MSKVMIIILLLLALIVAGFASVGFVSSNKYNYADVASPFGDGSGVIQDYTGTIRDGFSFFNSIGDTFQLLMKDHNFAIAPTQLYLVTYSRGTGNNIEFSYLLIYGNLSMSHDQFNDSNYYFGVYAYQDYDGSTQMDSFFNQQSGRLLRGKYGFQGNIEFGIGPRDWRLFNAGQSVASSLSPVYLQDQQHTYTWKSIEQFDLKQSKNYNFTIVANN